MSKSQRIVILGGGPAGTTTATLLAQMGYETTLLERAKFPRFSIGESLLPASQAIWRRLGVDTALKNAGFIQKKAGEFRLLGKDGHIATRNRFRNIPKNIQQQDNHAYQVERATFDQLLFDNAKKHGVACFDGVSGLTATQGEGWHIRWVDQGGKQHTIKGCFLIDATGRQCYLARKLALPTRETSVKTHASFAHFRGVSRETGPPGGYFNGYFLPDAWLWFIPLQNDITSVGLICNPAGKTTWQNAPQSALEQALGAHPHLRKRMAHATQLGQARGLKNLGHITEKLVGHDWAIVGDAAYFIDPLFSSGVHLAVYGAEQLADALHHQLDGHKQSLALYQERTLSRAQQVDQMVALIYQMLTHRSAIQQFVWGTGTVARHWSGPFLQRANAWGVGYFDHYATIMNQLRAIGQLSVKKAAAQGRLTRRTGWERLLDLKNPMTWPQVGAHTHLPAQERLTLLPQDQIQPQPKSLL